MRARQGPPADHRPLQDRPARHRPARRGLRRGPTMGSSTRSTSQPRRAASLSPRSKSPRLGQARSRLPNRQGRNPGPDGQAQRRRPASPVNAKQPTRIAPFAHCPARCRPSLNRYRGRLKCGRKVDGRSRIYERARFARSAGRSRRTLRAVHLAGAAWWHRAAAATDRPSLLAAGCHASRCSRLVRRGDRRGHPHG
jgi:hypothetical protein